MQRRPASSSAPATRRGGPSPDARERHEPATGALALNTGKGEVPAEAPPKHARRGQRPAEPVSPRPPAPRIGHNRGPPLAELILDNTLSVSLKDGCRITGFSADAMYDLIRAGEISTFTMGHRRFVIVQSLRDYLAKRAAEPLMIRAAPNSRKGGVKDGLAAAPAAKP